MEIELKLALDPRHAAKLGRHPLFGALKPARRQLVSDYFDTADFALMRRGIALRLRRVGYHRVQTMKAEAAAVGALSSRPEWEMAVAGALPDFAVFPPEALALLHGIDLAGIASVFVSEFRRVSWEIEVNGGRAEIALDRGEIRAGERCQPLSELEIELKSGDSAILFEVAAELSRAVPLRIEPRSKAERGYLLAGARSPAPVRAERPPLHAAHDAGEAWAGIVRAALTQLVANVPGFLEHPEDIEYLHQLRIALRRLRSAASLASGLGVPTPAWNAALRELMQALNPARDWDVFLLETLPRLQPELQAAPPDEPLLACLRAAMLEARKHARAAVASPAFTDAVLAIGRELLAPPHTGQVAADWSAGLLDKRWKNLRRLAAKLDRLGAGGLHETRIAAKKLRYAADALAPIHGKPRGGFLKALADLQDGLGQTNDLNVAVQLLRGLPPASDALAFEAGMLAGMLATEAARHGQVSAGLWHRLAKSRPFWQVRG